MLLIYPSMQSDTAVVSHIETQNGRRHPCGRLNDGYRHASAAAQNSDHGIDRPWALKKNGHGADMHPWPLRLSIYAARRTSAEETDQGEQMAVRSVVSSRIHINPAEPQP